MPGRAPELRTGPKRAMVLAAGLGRRMRPLTGELPKPLIPVAGRTLIDRVLDHLVNAGVEKVVVNLHHLGRMIEDHLKGRNDVEIVFSVEDELLDTGGAIAKALPLLDEKPFFAVNADCLWLNSTRPALTRMAEAWDEDRMDGLLLVHMTPDAYGYEGAGDFNVDPLGLVTRRPECEVSPFVYTGVQLLHPRLFAGAPEGAFSLNLLYDRAIEAARLYAVVHDGEWFHVGTPEALREAEEFMTSLYPAPKKRLP